MDQCLLDLGASVNLLPFSVYKQLGLGELQPTNLTSFLADRLVMVPKRIVENVMLKVDEFYFPVDFVVLDTKPLTNPNSPSLVILGRPFLATADAVIRCRNGVMTLSFGNRTVKLNAFHTGSQLPIMDDHEEVNMIDMSISHTFEESCYEDPLEKCLAHFGMNFDIDESIEEVNALLDYVPIMNTNLWKPKVEPFPMSTSVPVLLISEPPKLELKPLPNMLKYAFLGDSQTLPVIISSHLDAYQEVKLLDILSEYKEALGWIIVDVKGISPFVVMH